MILKAEIQVFLASKTEHNWMVNKCTRNSSFRAFKIHGILIVPPREVGIKNRPTLPYMYVPIPFPCIVYKYNYGGWWWFRWMFSPDGTLKGYVMFQLSGNNTGDKKTNPIKDKANKAKTL